MDLYGLSSEISYFSKWLLPHSIGTLLIYLFCWSVSILVEAWYTWYLGGLGPPKIRLGTGCINTFYCAWISRGPWSAGHTWCLQRPRPVDSLRQGRSFSKAESIIERSACSLRASSGFCGGPPWALGFRMTRANMNQPFCRTSFIPTIHATMHLHVYTSCRFERVLKTHISETFSCPINTTDPELEARWWGTVPSCLKRWSWRGASHLGWLLGQLTAEYCWSDLGYYSRQIITAGNPEWSNWGL